MRVSIYMACSVDGYVARTDGDLSWLNIVEGGEDYGMAEWLASVDVLVMGRATLEVVLGFGQWPYDGMRVFVASSSLTESPHPTATLVRGDPTDILAAASGAEHVWVDGPETGRRFLEAGVVDTITVTTLPVLLGDGIPFFPRGGPESALRLVQARSWDDGVTQAVYRPAKPGLAAGT